MTVLEFQSFCETAGLTRYWYDSRRDEDGAADNEHRTVMLESDKLIVTYDPNIRGTVALKNGGDVTVFHNVEDVEVFSYDPQLLIVLHCWYGKDKRKVMTNTYHLIAN